MAEFTISVSYSDTMVLHAKNKEEAIETALRVVNRLDVTVNPNTLDVEKFRVPLKAVPMYGTLRPRK